MSTCPSRAGGCVWWLCSPLRACSSRRSPCSSPVPSISSTAPPFSSYSTQILRSRLSASLCGSLRSSKSATSALLFLKKSRRSGAPNQAPTSTESAHPLFGSPPTTMKTQLLALNYTATSEKSTSSDVAMSGGLTRKGREKEHGQNCLL